MKKWIQKNCHDLKGKTFLILGSTGVLGMEVCKILADLNCNFIFANRNMDKTNLQTNELTKQFPNIKIDTIQIDLVDHKSVITATDKLKDMHVDYVILNSGAYKTKKTKSNLDFDNVFQTNFVSQYYLSKQILIRQKPKFIVVGSIAYKKAKLNTKDIDYSKGKNAQKIYGNSKRFLMFSLYKLFRENNVKFSIVHPGITPTNITRNYNKFLKLIIKFPMKILFNSPKKSALSIISGVFDKCQHLEWIGPKVCNIWGYPNKKPITNITENEITEIFENAEKIYNNILQI